MDEREESADTVWDVAVVGAGPAGTSAALAAARGGCRVILLERAALPRYKTCGGGLIGLSLAAVPAGLTLPVRATIREFTFSLKGRLTRTRRSPDPILSMVCRDEFDAALAGQAAAAGVTVRDGALVTGVQEHGGLAELALSGGGTCRARAVVGADGSASRVGRYVGVECGQVDLGLEVELPMPAHQARSWASRLQIDWGPLPGSYGWVFPKGDSLTVGVIAARGQGAATRAYLRDFLARLGLADVPPTVDSGHLTRCRTDASPLARGRALVAGDAAGLLEPFTREGISFALRSGTLAGQAAARVARAGTAAGVDEATAGYTRQVAATLGTEMSGGRLFHTAFSAHPRFFYLAAIGMPKVWPLFVRVITGQASLAHVAAKGWVRFVLTRLGRTQVRATSTPGAG